MIVARSLSPTLRLLTTYKITNFAEALRIVALDRMRWTIKEFFRLLETRASTAKTPIGAIYR
jgi:hypothetical protein